MLALARNALFGWQRDTVCTRGDEKKKEFIDQSLRFCFGCIRYEYKKDHRLQSLRLSFMPIQYVLMCSLDIKTQLFIFNTVDVSKRKLGVIVDIVINTSGQSCVAYLGIILRSQEDTNF